MKEEWKYERIGNLFNTFAGGTPHKSHNEYYQGGNIPWLMSGEVCQKYISKTENYITEEGLKNSSAKYYPINTVVVAMYGATAAQVGILKAEMTSNQAVCGILPRKDFLPEFIYYWFVHIKDKLAAQAQGGAQPNLSQVKIKNVEIPFISCPEQQRIVEYLDTQFAKIDALKANAAQQLQAAKDLFQSALKDLMTPKDGWEEKKLGEICTHIVDCPHTTPKKATQKTNYPCIRTSELKNGTIFWDSMQYLDENEYLKRVTRLVPQADDIVYGREGTFGDAVLLPEGYKFSLGQRTMLLRPNQDIVIPKYLHYAIISPQVFAQAQEKNTGCGVPHVNVADVKQFKICYSSDILNQQNVVSQLDKIYSNCEQLQSNYEQTITLCSDLKQSLLKQTFE